MRISQPFEKGHELGTKTAIIPFPSFDEDLFDVPVVNSAPGHVELGAADIGPAPSVLDLPGQPGQTVTLALAFREHIHGVFERHGPESRQPARRFGPQVRGLWRDVMDTQKPVHVTISHLTHLFRNPEHPRRPDRPPQT
ncbi:hypothetical protein DSECCO2_590960 [anaerobic digester metagenome]